MAESRWDDSSWHFVTEDLGHDRVTTWYPPGTSAIALEHIRHVRRGNAGPMSAPTESKPGCVVYGSAAAAWEPPVKPPHKHSYSTLVVGCHQCLCAAVPAIPMTPNDMRAIERCIYAAEAAGHSREEITQARAILARGEV